MNLFLAPHNDDETLFGAFTLMREKPHVVVLTDSYIQPNRGEVGCGPIDRMFETKKAMEILGCSYLQVGIRDDSFSQEVLGDILSRFHGFDKVYVPALQGGNIHHDLTCVVATKVFGEKCKYYTTYTKTELYTKGKQEIVPTVEELELKNKAMECYTSQLRINGPHFDAVRGKSEWLI